MRAQGARGGATMGGVGVGQIGTSVSGRGGATVRIASLATSIPFGRPSGVVVQVAGRCVAASLPSQARGARAIPAIIGALPAMWPMTDPADEIEPDEVEQRTQPLPPGVLIAGGAGAPCHTLENGTTNPIRTSSVTSGEGDVNNTSAPLVPMQSSNLGAHKSEVKRKTGGALVDVSLLVIGVGINCPPPSSLPASSIFIFLPRLPAPPISIEQFAHDRLGGQVPWHLDGNRDHGTSPSAAAVFGQARVSADLDATRIHETRASEITLGAFFNSEGDRGPVAPVDISLVEMPPPLPGGISVRGPCVSRQPDTKAHNETHVPAFISGPPGDLPANSFVASCPPTLVGLVALILLVVRPRVKPTSQTVRPPPLQGRTGSIAPRVVAGDVLGWKPCGGMASGGVPDVGPPPGVQREAVRHASQFQTVPTNSVEAPGIPLSWGMGHQAASMGSVRRLASATSAEPAPSVQSPADGVARG